MRKTLIRQGKVSKNNALARARIAEIAEEKGLDRCELGLEGCLEYYTLAPAHRHRREFYRASVEALSDYNNWVILCVNCHEHMDDDENYKEEVFKKLRGQNGD